MKSKINSIVISSLFVFAVFAGIPKAFENAFAQEGAITPEGTVNDTMSGENATQWANATLVFAQEGFTTEDLVNETINLGNDTTMMNATLAFAQQDDNSMNQNQGNETGSIQSQSNEAKNDGNNEEEEGDDE
jgi:hypothetical protein